MSYGWIAPRNVVRIRLRPPPGSGLDRFHNPGSRDTGAKCLDPLSGVTGPESGTRKTLGSFRHVVKDKPPRLNGVRCLDHGLIFTIRTGYFCKTTKSGRDCRLAEPNSTQSAPGWWPVETELSNDT